jgi:hypothetical protein
LGDFFLKIFWRKQFIEIITFPLVAGPLPHWQKLAAYLLITLSIVIIWAATIPGWPIFLEQVLQAHDLNLVLALLTHLVSLATGEKVNA